MNIILLSMFVKCQKSLFIKQYTLLKTDKNISECKKKLCEQLEIEYYKNCPKYNRKMCLLHQLRCYSFTYFIEIDNDLLISICCDDVV